MSTSAPPTTTRPAPAGKAASPVGQRLSLLGVNPGVLFGFLFLLILLWVTTPSFRQLSTLQHLVQQVSINAIIAVGMTFVIITAGIDLSVGSVVGFVGTITALTLLAPSLVSRFGDGVMVIAAVVGLCGGALVGFLNGAAVAYLRMQPFIVTLATMWAVRGIAEVMTGDKPVGTVSPDQPLAAVRNDLIQNKFTMLGMGSVGHGSFQVPVSALIALVVIILGHVLLRKTIFGRHVYALGGNPEAARLSGINVERARLLVFTLSGTLAGIAAVLQMSKLVSGLPTAGMGFELDAIAAVVVGGTSLFGGSGSVIGSVIGALIIGVINMGLNLHDISTEWQQIVTGAIILVAVFLDEVVRRRRG